MGWNLRFDLWFFRNTLFVYEKFFILFRAKGGELPLEVGKDNTLVPNFLLHVSRFLLQSFPCNNFIRDLEGSCKLVLEANQLV